MLRRKTNRRHMTSDHHGPVAERATLLVRAVDEILGTHRTYEVSRWWRAGRSRGGPAGRRLARSLARWCAAVRDRHGRWSV
jgi:hypothetical protein